MKDGKSGHLMYFHDFKLVEYETKHIICVISKEDENVN